MSTHPNRIGKFEIMEPLGEGVLGAVFLARDTIIGREVVLRTIQGAPVGSAEARERFLREAQAASRLAHPNLASTHEVGEAAGAVYLATEYVGGESLAQLLAERSLSPQELLELLAQVCDGLAYAHGRGVFHRDLKPANIRITRVSGRPTAKILDFGIARPTGGDISATGSIIGNFSYLAPEHARPGKPDGKPDLFAVGVILYEALAGVLPFEGDTPAASLNRLQNEEPAPLDLEKLSTISPAIQGVLDRALAKDPARRFASAAALAASLREARNPAWSPQADAERAERSARSLRVPGLTRNEETASTPGKPSFWIAAVASVAVLALLAGAGGYLWRRHRRRAHAPVLAPPPVPAPVAIPVPVAPVPNPEPPPQPEAPKAPESKSRFKTLDEAEAGLAQDPREALVFLEEAMAADPADERALALRMVALYSLGRYGTCAKAMGEAKAAGHPLLALSQKYPRFKKMLEAEKIDPKLPRKPKSAPEA